MITFLSRYFIFGLLLSIPFSISANVQEYTLVIDKQTVNITGESLQRITLNGGIPGPTLEFTEGDVAVIHVTNRLDEETSVHWHGLLLPGKMDGVPGFGGFPGIKPGETFTYRFDLRQSGTYWYHAHSMAQEQDGHYGSIIIHPKQGDIAVDRDYVVLLSDFHQDEGIDIMSNLKKSSEHYVYVKRTVPDFLADVKQYGFQNAWQEAKMWGQMRMPKTDLADVGNYTFLINGKTPKQNWTGLFKPGEKVRLRFINAAAMSFFDVRIPGLKMTVVAADGQAVEPVEVDEFRFGVSETYDVIVEPQRSAYAIMAEPLDRTGYALATLAQHDGLQAEKPEQRAMSLLTMADMGMMHGDDHGGHMDHGAHAGHQMNHTEHNHHQHHTKASSSISTSPVEDFDTGVPGSGWANAHTPAGYKALTYKDLRFLGQQSDVRPPEREIEVRLGGNMKRYIWTLNGEKFSDAEPIKLNYGERIRLVFINETMMAHPMHLHGMFMQVENGQPLDKLPNKHTVMVAPGDRYSVLLTANEAGEWPFHCHLLYHMMAGMMNKLIVADSADKAVHHAH